MDKCELLARLRAATGPSRNLDAEIEACLRVPSAKAAKERWVREWAGEWRAEGARVRLMHSNGTPGAHWAPDLRTGSIDAALALVEKTLPGAEYDITTLYGVAHVNLPMNFTDVPYSTGRRLDGNVPLAILEASVDALIAQENSNG